MTRFQTRLRILVVILATGLGLTAAAQDLQSRLTAEGAASLAKAAAHDGDPQRGAILFHQPYLGCVKCHDVTGDGDTAASQHRLGPDLTAIDRKLSAEEIVESILAPSKVIAKGFESISVQLDDGRSIAGLLAKETGTDLMLRNPTDGSLVTMAKSSIEHREHSKTSIMPADQVNQLASRQQFLDLAKYLIEVREGGQKRARQLQPPPSLIALALPEYESRVDHAGMIRALDSRAFARGQAIYDRLCVNCHGTHDQPGSLPTSLAFATGRFKNGGDPFAMYQTLTRGFGLMPPQTWMVPQQKYDVIHYIREAYLRPHNPSQYAEVNDEYLNHLPKGDTRGPAPRTIEPWVTMDYGPSLINTYEIGRDGTNFAQKGIAVRLDSGPGGISRGKAWIVFDHDTLRMAGAWTGSGFIDWNGIHFNGRHQVHPRVVGDVLASNPTGPGWADPETGGFDDDRRIIGRDGRRYGPLPRTWGQYRGLYHDGDRVIISYTIGQTDILESPGVKFIPTPSDEPAPARNIDKHATQDNVGADSRRRLQAKAKDKDKGQAPLPAECTVFTRSLHIRPRNKELLLLVATNPTASARLVSLGAAVRFGSDRSREGSALLAGLVGSTYGCTWTDFDNRLCLRIPAGSEPLNLQLWFAREVDRLPLDYLLAAIDSQHSGADLKARLQGGQPRWPQTLTTAVVLGKTDGPFAIDTLTHPINNPWLAQMRFTGIDFYPDSDRAVVCAWDGDVWLVRGLASLGDATHEDQNTPRKLSWQRIASGLFQPLGIKIVDGQIFVTCRDQLVILRDLNGDGETDFYECFNNDHQVTEHFHEFAMGLQVDDQGRFYYAKSARHALPAVVPHHGTLLRISKDGAKTEILATGFRAANGVCLNPDGTYVVTDQEGHWNPKNRINWVTEGGFYGNMLAYHDVKDTSDNAMQQPLCWITNDFDRSPAELLWIPQKTWGPLAGSLLNLSYGYGKLFVVPFEDVRGRKQGGMCALPVAPVPTGLVRGRFSPRDGHLYTCGMFAWAGSATQPGGLYRIRYTGRPMYLPIGLKARRGELDITFTDAIDPVAASDPSRYSLKTWGLKRTAEYGSPHINEKPLKIASVQLSEDGRMITLRSAGIAQTWGMEIVCRLKGTDGQSFERTIHNSIFDLGE
jgi:putative heme-binding domain-containing protein